jgi:hypothetical protein
MEITLHDGKEALFEYSAVPRFGAAQLIPAVAKVHEKLASLNIERLHRVRLSAATLSLICNQ